jgi:hypothetical protein
MLHVTFGLMVQKLWGLMVLRFQPKLGHAVSHCQYSKIYPKLPKFAKICPKTIRMRNFKMPTKFLCVEETLEYVFTVWIFNIIIFHMSFLLSKNGLCMWISAYPLVENDFFLNVPHLLWVWDFEDMYLTHLETRMERHTPYLL